MCSSGHAQQTFAPPYYHVAFAIYAIAHAKSLLHFQTEKQQMILEKLIEIRDGLRWGLSTNLELSDESLEYNLYEQFEPFVWSLLHPDNLRPFVIENGISEEQFALLQSLRELWVENLENEKAASEVRQTSSPIRQAMDIADQVWKRLEIHLSRLGKPSEAVTSTDDTRPRTLLMT